MAEEKEQDPKEAIGDLVLWLSVFVATLLAKGFCVKVLWAWFISDTFGFRRISMPEALGLMLLFLSVQRSPKTDLSKKASLSEAFKSLCVTVAIVAISLGCGWIFHQLI
jgi:F0F1-type ATP synthase assembly protein I